MGIVLPVPPNDPLAKFVSTLLGSGDLEFLLRMGSLFLPEDVQGLTELEVETITWSFITSSQWTSKQWRGSLYYTGCWSWLSRRNLAASTQWGQGVIRLESKDLSGCLNAPPCFMFILLKYCNNSIEAGILMVQNFKEQIIWSPGHKARNHDQPWYLLSIKRG